MRTILVMSFTGTCMTVLYGIGKKILKRETTHALYYVWLKICVASYLIPLLDLKYMVHVCTAKTVSNSSCGNDAYI